jgi:putative copper resistance protein D
VTSLADRRGITPALIAAAGVSLVVLVIVATLTGITDSPVVPGIDEQDPLVRWSLPIMQWLRDLSALLTVGFVLVGGLLTAAVDHKFLRIAMAWTVVFLASSALLAWITLADVYLLPAADALNVNAIRLFVTDTIPGRVALYQVVALVVALALIAVASTRRQCAIAFVLVLTAAAAPAFNGHAGLGGGHESATASLALHIASLSVWVGGLVATAVLVSNAQPGFDKVVSRFSTIALWCVIIAAETGLINASMRLTTWRSVFDTTYGQLILAKSLILIILILFGWQLRRNVLPELSATNRKPFVMVAITDIVIMGIALALSVVLSRTDPNAVSQPATLPLSYFWTAVILTSAGAYGWAMWLAHKKTPWPLWRAGAFALALVAIAAGSAEFSGEYSQVGFAVHVLQTTLLTFVAPLLIVVALPMVIDTPFGRALRAFPEAVAIGLIFAFYLVIFGPLYDIMMVTHEGHLVMQLVLLAAGFFFVVAVIGRSVIAIVIPMVVWPFILIAYPTPQALANVVLTELVLVVILIATVRVGKHVRDKEVNHERAGAGSRT